MIDPEQYRDLMLRLYALTFGQAILALASLALR